MKYYGKDLIERREQLGISQAKLAQLCGLGNNDISRLETEKQLPDKFITQRLNEFFYGKEPFKPFMTEQDMLTAKPLLDTYTGPTVGDVTPEKLELQTFWKAIY